jgi:N-acetylated-alpha-linked acidic dipeptidase
MGWVCGLGVGLGLAVPCLLGQGDPAPCPKVFGFRDFAGEAQWDKKFLAVPDPALAREHLKRLTAAPHWASSPEDYATALYVAEKFKDAGLATTIVPYRVQMNKPIKILVEAFGADGARIMSGPTPEHVDPTVDGGDPFQNDPRILPAFSGSSPSGDVNGAVVYANYGTYADFKHLDEIGVSVRDKIVIVRYGMNFRGVKAYLAQQRGARGVLIYSDPGDDGFMRGEVYPRGPYRPESAVQRGSAQFLPIFPGDPTTPGYASVPDLPDAKRIQPGKAQVAQPSIPVNPLSFKDAEPILEALGGASVPASWQGAGTFNYHVGAKGKKAVKVHLRLDQDIALRTIWDVIGTIPGTGSEKDETVIAGNHRDAWVFGAVDPSSGTAAMLESVHGLGVLLKAGWKPRRTLIVASWDAEEEGLIGSVEWVEGHAELMRHTVAYLNTDVGVSGSAFTASSVPSLKEFVSDVTREVPSPAGGTVFAQWRLDQERGHPKDPMTDPKIDALGSGSDYTPFLQHAGVASTDIGSNGPYGVYHSAFDNFNWFVKNADPDFVYEQQQARVFGLEMIHMADAEVLPMDYGTYGAEVVGYLADARKKAEARGMKLDFTAAESAAKRFEAAGIAVRARQDKGAGDLLKLNRALRETEAALLLPAGLPGRGWYKHSIFSPGEYTGYAAVVIPGVNEAITLGDAGRAREQMQGLVEALGRASGVLEAVR